MSTANMGLTLPTVSTTIGPTWATMLNTAFTQVDAHTHVVGAGQGVPISAAALAIDGDVSWGDYSLLSVASVQLADQGTTLGANRVYNNGGDLYFTNGSGTPVQITVGGSVAGASGNITGLTAPASASWSAITGFVWQSAALTGGIMDCGPILLRTSAASSNAVTLTPASATTAYTLTLPSAVPAANSFLAINTSGTLSYISQSGGITGSMIGTGTITTNNLSSLNSAAPGYTTASTTLTTFSALGNISTLTTVGRNGFSNIFYVLRSVSGAGFIEIANNVDGLVAAEIRIRISPSVPPIDYFENTQTITAYLQGSGTRYFRIPLSSFSGFFQVGITGAFQLQMQARITGGSGSPAVGFTNFVVACYEL
jgi:hypothetical protein